MSKGKSEAENETQQRWNHYRALPFDDYKKLSGGRPAKVLREIAKNHGLPINPDPKTDTVNLQLILTAFHDLLVKYKHVLAGEHRAETIGHTRVEAERRILLAKAEREELKLNAEMQKYVSADAAQNDRLELTKFFVSVLNRAGAELGPQVTGLSAIEVKQIVVDYFGQMRDDIVQLASLNGKSHALMTLADERDRDKTKEGKRAKAKRATTKNKTAKRTKAAVSKR